ncbi:uncharacterized protein LOC141875008 [Acropora palmata]|uniref:uncharacterized protein LOC141875008 n=1 Tax=Acropora palmata TaxID=6131 RepID=UPI003DA0B32F
MDPFIGWKARKQLSNGQALRRLKYLHTSVLPKHDDKNTQSEHKFKNTLWTKGLQREESAKGFITPAWNSEKKSFMSLQLKTEGTHNNERAHGGRVPRCGQTRKAICTGHTPLQTPIIGIPGSQTEGKEQWFHGTRKAVEQVRRSAKSAPEALRSIDAHSSVDCSASDFRHAHKKQTTKRYYTNITINRITFSARQSHSKSLVREKRNECPEGRVLNGWGAWRKKESRDNTIQRNSKWQKKDTSSVTASIKTQKLESRKSKTQQEYTDKTIPTPIRQIDITLPQGIVLKYDLPEDD